MSFTEITALKQKRAGLVKECQGILDKPEYKSGSPLSTEDNATYEARWAEVESLNTLIERKEQIEGFTGDNSPQARVSGNIKSKENNEEITRNSDKYKETYQKYMRNGRNSLSEAEKRIMTIGDDGKGGLTAPDDFEKKVLDFKKDKVIMRQLAYVFSRKNDTKFAILDDDGASQYILENGAYPESDPSLKADEISAHKLGRISKISEELLNDSYENMINFVSRIIARSQAKGEEEKFIIGNGTNCPTGIVPSASTGATASAIALTSDLIYDLIYSLDEVDRMNAVMLLNNETVKAIRKMKDVNGNYIWVPGLQAGEPDRIAGYTFKTSEFMPKIEASARPIVFGDMKSYWICDRQGLNIQVLKELYAANGQIGIRAFMRNDGKLMNKDAVKALVLPAA